MNLLSVSEKHGLLIIAIDSELVVFNLDPATCMIRDP